MACNCGKKSAPPTSMRQTFLDGIRPIQRVVIEREPDAPPASPVVDREAVRVIQIIRAGQ